MSVTQTYPFNSAADYNRSNVEVTGGLTKLSLVSNPGQIFAQDFNSDSGFTYDSAKAEFTGGLLRQKDQRPTGAVLAAKYENSSFDLNWCSSGSLIATLVAAPTISGGKLQCLTSANQGVIYSNAGIGSVSSLLTMKLKYTPNYSSTPGNINVFEIKTPGSDRNRVNLLLSSNNFLLAVYDDSTTLKINFANMGAFSATPGQEYEIELNLDAVTGVARLFVDGVLKGTNSPGTFTRGTTATDLYIGAGAIYSVNPSAEWNDVILFSNIQHTSGYTAGYSIPDYIYASTKIDGPNFTYSGIGTVLSVDDGTVTESGAPRYIVGLKYWNGSAWVTSNGSYAQANSFATAVANFPSFVASGGVLPWSVVFTDSNNQSSVDDFSVEVTGQKYSPTGYLEPVQGINVQSLVAYDHTATVPTDTDVKIILKVDGVLKYHDGANWVDSDGSEAQSNTLAEFLAKLDEYVFGANSTVYLRWLLVTDDDNETPELLEAEIEYNFGAIEIEAATCDIYGYYKDIANNPVAGATVTFSPSRASGVYQEAHNNIIEKSVSVVTDANGYFLTPLIRSSEYSVGGDYLITIVKSLDSLDTSKDSAGVALTFQVPDADTKDITDLLP